MLGVYFLPCLLLFAWGLITCVVACVVGCYCIGVLFGVGRELFGCVVFLIVF